MTGVSTKIVLKNATKFSLDRRFGDIAKQTPRHQPTVTVSYVRDEIFQQKRASANERRQEIMMRNRPSTIDIANRLKKRSINYRLGRGFGNYNRGGMGRFNVNQRLTGTSGVLQRVTLGRGRRMGGNLFSSRGGNRNPRRAGLTIGRERTGLRTFRGRFSRGFNNNNNLQSNQNNSKRNGFQSGRGRGASIRSFRGNRGNGNNSRGNSNRGVGNFRGRGRGAKNNENQSKNNNKNNDNNTSVTKEKLDSDLDRYMSQTKIDNSFDILNSNGSN